MNKFQAFLGGVSTGNGGGENPPPNPNATATAPTIALSNPIVQTLGCNNPNAINYNEFSNTDDGTCVFETSTIEANDVNFLALIGHSQIAGKGYNNPPGSPTGDYIQEEDKILNDMMWSQAGGAFVQYNVQALINANYFDHGREAYINVLWKNYLNNTNGLPLYLAKTVVVGAAPHSKFMIGGRYWENSWNNQIRPKINELVAQGKKVVIYFIFDMWVDDVIYGSNEMFDVYHSHWCIARALGIKEINANLTTSVTNANWNDAMNNISFPNYVSADPTRRSLSNGVGMATTDGVHWSANTLKFHAINHLTAIQNQPRMKISWNIPIIKGMTMAFKYNTQQIARNFFVSWDVPCEARVFTDREMLHSQNITSIRINVSQYRNGFVTLIGDLTGLTRFEAPFTGTCAEFEVVDKYVATLNYLDLRGNSLPNGSASFIVAYSNDYNVQKLAQGNVSNGTLKISGAVGSLTASSRTHYDTLINRGWTIDVARP